MGLVFDWNGRNKDHMQNFGGLLTLLFEGFTFFSVR
jgi:hypothetical protein